jgi:methionine synthase I (cobalamin-dependent)
MEYSLETGIFCGFLPQVHLIKQFRVLQKMTAAADDEESGAQPNSSLVTGEPKKGPEWKGEKDSRQESGLKKFCCKLPVKILGCCCGFLM